MTILLNERNEGIARALNQAVRWAPGKGFQRLLTLEDDTWWMSSGSLIALRVFGNIYLFNEDLFVYYVDQDFFMRLVRGGFRVYVCPEAVRLHKVRIPKAP